MHPSSHSPPGKRGPNRQLLTTLRIPTHIPASQQDDSPRRISTVIWRTCLIIAGLVVLNAALAAVILTAVRGLGRAGSSNVLMQPPAMQSLRQPFQSFLAQRNQQDIVRQEGGAQQTSKALQVWEKSLGRLLSRSDRFWAGTVEAYTSGKSDLAGVKRMSGGGQDQDTDLPAEPQDAQFNGKDSIKARNGSRLNKSMRDSSLEADSGHLNVDAELQDNLVVRQYEAQQQQQSDGQAKPADVRYPDGLGHLISELASGPGSGLPSFQPDPQAAITAHQIQSLQEGLSPAAAGPERVAADTADPVLALELVSQVPMPSEAEAGSHTRLSVSGVQNWPVVAAAPLVAPLSAPQVEEANPVALPSNSLATDLQKGQFFPTRGQAAQVRTRADMGSAGDITGDIHAQEEHAKAIASTAEVKNGRQVSAAPGPARMENLPDPCASALNIPKVAIMFMSKAELFHESSWALWFQHAAGLLPVSALRSDPDDDAAQCSTERLELAQRYCSNPQSVAVLQRQHLFSVYLHPLPDFGSFPEESIFHGREIQDRIQVSWGAHELVMVARNLMGAALKDPLNRKFILLSESGLPLYPPTTTYLQLMQEDKSRLDSCGMGRTDPWRFGVRMGYKLRRHWRKSSQWFALKRKHAELIMQDTELLYIFQQHCQNAWDNDLNRWRDCFSDEHYMPSLIAYLQLGHETDCVGKLVNVDWSVPGAHPHSYSPLEISAGTFQRLRMGFYDGRPCNPVLAIGSSAGAFVRAGSISLQDAAQQVCSRRGYNASALTYDCALFARKFPSHTASAAQHLLASCSSGLNITSDSACDDSAEEIPHQRVSSAHAARRILQRHMDPPAQPFASESERWGGERQGVTAGRQHIPTWLEDRL